jgi:hypothetical protein
VQRKRSNEKLKRKKLNVPSYKTFLFPFFLLFRPLLLSNLITFLLLNPFKQFEVLQECHRKFYKSSLNFNSNRTTYKELFGCLKTSLYSVQWFFFFEFLTPFTLGGHNFLIFNPIRCAKRRTSTFVWTP